MSGGPTRGERVYLIREALGTRRDPMPMERFAEIIARTSGAVYDKSTLSRMETGDRKVSIEDIEAIAPVDPLKRGKTWLAAWDDELSDEGREGAPTNGAPDLINGPTIQRQLPKEVSRLDEEKPSRKGVAKRRPHGRTALAG